MIINILQLMKTQYATYVACHPIKGYALKHMLSQANLMIYG